MSSWAQAALDASWPHGSPRTRPTRVLLLEAGPPDEADEIHIPAALNLLFQSQYDWDFRTVPQERAGSRSVYWPRGRMLGGSSSMNAMIYIRGNRLDYDTWRDDYGCTGWGYADIVPYFLRAEDNSRGSSAYHGIAGPLSVQDLKHKSPLTRAFVAASRECGLPANEDFNGAGPGRHRLLPGHPARRAALVSRGCLPSPRHLPAQPDRAHRRAGHRDHRGRRPRHRGALSPPWRGGGGPGRGGSHPVGGQPSAARICCCCPVSARPSSSSSRGSGSSRTVRG